MTNRLGIQKHIHTNGITKVGTLAIHTLVSQDGIQQLESNIFRSRVSANFLSPARRALVQQLVQLLVQLRRLSASASALSSSWRSSSSPCGGETVSPAASAQRRRRIGRGRHRYRQVRLRAKVVRRSRLRSKWRAPNHFDLPLLRSKWRNPPPPPTFPPPRRPTGRCKSKRPSPCTRGRSKSKSEGLD